MHHHHHSEEECGAHSHCECPCHEQHGHRYDYQHFTKQLIELADNAWMEVLKDKLKAQVEALSSKELDELAKIVAQANHERWRHKLAQENTSDNLKQQVDNFFNKSSKK